MSSSKKYKAADVCRELGIQPYVLRYWETEFAALQDDRAKTTYAERHLTIARRIKELLYDEGYTIAGAKKKLQAELASSGSNSKKSARSKEGDDQDASQQALLVEESAGDSEAGVDATSEERPQDGEEAPGDAGEDAEEGVSREGSAEETTATEDETEDPGEEMAASERSDGSDPADDSSGKRTGEETSAPDSPRSSAEAGEESADLEETDREAGTVDGETAQGNGPASEDSAASSPQLDRVARQQIQTIVRGLHQLRREAEELLEELRGS